MEKYINPWIKKIKQRPFNPQRPEGSVDLYIGENPYPPSPHVLKAIAAAAENINKYPDSAGDAVKEKLAAYTKANKEQIVIGNGSDDLIELMVKVFVKQKEKVIIPIPGYFSYWRSTKIRGGVPVFVNRKDNFELDIEKIVQADAKLVFIGSPNNPTGNIVSQEEIIEILEKMDCIIVVDECYFEFSQNTVIDLLQTYENLIVLRSLSKTFGLAGLRFGYAIAHPTLIQYFNKAIQMYPVNKLAQAAVISSLDDLEYLKANIQKICQEREVLTEKIGDLGFTVYPSETNFLLVRTEALNISGNEIVASLKSNNIFVQNIGLKPGLDAYYFKTAIGTKEENEILLKHLKQIVSNR
ncbi:MAG: Histidinol-phosphate aminotransferase [Candidatus Magnetoglobus multicellularis str. Araruama]|uniref:histidinol-phosphate transaminase n=1 Tax=Candidatus Magnetoglobus multicellularis str. Araruama TaxID=890399 RepID=A0A1V1PBX7_9BACT|nr:MAG: Histidinol-phosphate aminotransferase [Candidatus Magnetoglobus multicellularis str. Araruama]